MSKVSPLLLPSKACRLLSDCALERDSENIFYYQRDLENYMDEVLNFLLSDRHEYTHSILQSVILVSILMLLVYVTVTGLCYWFMFSFFVLQDLICRIDSYFQRIAFQRNLVFIGF